MGPLIGISMAFDHGSNMAKLSEKYINAVERAGGAPLAVPPLEDKKLLNVIIQKLDGIILTGGPDIDPSYYNQAPHQYLGNVCHLRDASEIYLAAEFKKLSKPILGICRGLQVINVAMGGSLYQDIPSIIENSINHMQKGPRHQKSHEIEIVDFDSFTYQIIGKSRIMVNSFHHQSVEEPAPDLKITAKAADGVVEAMELKGGGFCIGVQWHPEELIDDRAHMRLFECLVHAAKDVKTRRK